MDEVDRIRSLIQEQQDFSLVLAKTCDQNKEIVESVFNNLRLLYTSIRNKPIVKNDLHLILGNLSRAVLTLVDDYEQRLVEDEKVKQLFKTVPSCNV